MSDISAHRLCRLFIGLIYYLLVDVSLARNRCINMHPPGPMLLFSDLLDCFIVRSRRARTTASRVVVFEWRGHNMDKTWLVVSETSDDQVIHS